MRLLARATPALVALVALAVIPGCEEDDPDGTGSADAAPPADAPATPDADPLAPDAAPCPTVEPHDESACVALGTDYVSTDLGSDGWAACVSDMDVNAYSPFDPSIGTQARVAAFETIAPLLWDKATPPTAQDFTDARVEYALDQGLESRATRREDEHYAPVTNGMGMVVACNTLTPAELAANADRCVGPAKITPIINAAFADGMAGTGDPRVHAARLEAALLWFFYVSVHKEAVTCTNVQKDCDSSYAYYAGDTTRPDAGEGLSRYVKALGGKTHDRVWDGILAVRCWRDLDNPTGTAMNPMMRDVAVAQLDRAALHGVASIVRARLTSWLASCMAPAAQAVDWAFLEVLGPVLVREAKQRGLASGAALEAFFATPSPTPAQAVTAIADLDSVFDCP